MKEQRMQPPGRHRLSDTAMVLAAGLGTRMRPITLTTPKPLVPIAGRAMIDHVLDRLLEAGVRRAVVNVHHLPDQVERHVRARVAPEIAISDERALLLDSGGGTKKALPALGGLPFLLANCDTVWIENTRPTMRRLVENWDGEAMDVLLLVAETATAVGFDGRGDFLLGPDARLERRGERAAAPFVYAGIAIIRPELFAGMPDGPFSLNRVFDRAAQRDRLFGLRLDGTWMHVGTPGAIAEAEACMAAGAA